MAKSRRKKNYKLRKRVMRTVAALTMIMAIVVAAIPVENYGTMRAADARNLDTATAENELNKSGESHYDRSKYEQGYGTVPKTVQRIRVANDGTLSLVDMFEVKTKDSNAIITKDIIGDGSHIGETELSINQTEYCNYVQFDPDFIRDVKTALDNAGGFQLTFQQDQESTLEVPSSVATVSPITVKTIKKDNPTDKEVTVSVTIDPNNENARGYTEFGTIRLSSSSMYAQDFGKARYDAKMVQIDAYNADVNAFITKVNAFITKVSDSSYTWESKDANEWTGYVNEAQNLNSNYNTTALLSDSWNDFNKNADNGLEGIIDYIIRNYCKKGNTDLVDYQLKSLLRQNDKGDVITVYVPQYTKPGTYNWLDENNYLPATADSKVIIVGIASYVDSNDSAFYKTTLNKITLPQGIQFIGENAFGDSNLTEVTINTTACEIIGEGAFAECTSLSTVNFEFSGDVASNRFITIDKKAFYNTAITSVTIPSPVTTIGVGAFAGIRALTTVDFDDSSRGSGRDIAIEKYAFYNCDGLNDVKFPTNNSSQYVIGEGVFAVGSASNSLINFTFPGGNTKIDYSGDIKYKDNFIGDCDYILANRDALETVTFPGKLDSKIPDNTLSGCNNLSWVKFPEGAKIASYEPDKLFADVWGDLNFYVEGPETKGSPNTRSVPRETTWKAKAGYYDEEYIDEYGNKQTRPKWVLTSVPYKFTDANGNVHFEIGVKEKEEDTNPTYIATIDVIDEGKKEAQLSEYFKYDQKDLTENIEITIPAMVGEYHVVSIADNCFNTDENLRKHIYRLNILDDSVREIKAEAFMGMEELQWVFIGDAVTSIGASAFENCNKLENVEFSQTFTEFYSDTDWENALTIGNNAFKTGSEFLTFHGAINPEYAPFKLAMSEESSSMTSQKSKANICYKTDAPLHLTVIRDSDGKATLIDYPHYEEIDDWNKELIAEMSTDEDGNPITDYSITEKFEIVNGIKDNNNNKNYQDTLGDMEEKVVEQVLNMELPAGIQNIDTKGYFTNDDNANDFGYFNKIYVEVTKGDKVIGYKSDTLKRELNPFNTSAETDVRKLYSTYEGLKDDKVKTVPGLFSGFFDESENEVGTQTYGFISQNDTKFIWGSYRGHTYTENNNRGNDYLTSINMPTVEKLQNYAFDSNENVKELTVGRALNEIGVQPFKDCKSLWQIHTGDSTKYEFENMILYDKAPVNGSGGYKIVQGLEGRGRDAADGDYGSNKITVDSNPLLAQVTDVADYAFANNEEVVRVDFSKTNIRNIADGTFNGCGELMEVVLPDKTKFIGDFSFGGVNKKNFTLEVPNKDCQISQKAFKLDESDNPSISGVTIKGIMYDEDGDYSTTYDSFLKLQQTYGENKVEWAELGKTYILHFYDQQTFQPIGDPVQVEVKEGETSASLVGNPPSAPAHTGYEFDYWTCPKILDADGKPLINEKTWTDVTEDRDIYAVYKRSPASVVPDGNDYTLTVVNGKALVKDSNDELQLITTFPQSFKGGTQITVIANDEENFKTWSTSPSKHQSLLQNSGIYTTTLTMPNDNIVVTANSAIGGGSTGGDTPNPDGTYTVTVNNGTGGGNYRPGATVTITANAAPTGQTFTNWTTTGVTLTNANSASTTFTMPSSNVTATANYSGGNGGNNQGGNTGDGNQGGNTGDNNNNTTKYKVTVNYGSGSGEYAAGETVNITANAPENSNRVFSRWTTSNSGLGFANANSVSTSFVMPATDVTVTANYKTRTSSDDDDDDTPSRRPGTNTSTTTVNNRPSSSTSTTTSTTGTVNNPESGTSTTNNNNNGNKIYITKNGISNTDVASLAVSGSTDNFIVRITESAEATAAVEQVLTNTYGSLNGLAYLPMDISLYDSTGQNKITDTHGLNITVTMPIPDVLIQYGGNARVAAADNGVLQQITPRFTTIDGIACISFIPPHFSPYVIYVDTNNLIAGQMLDSTPATGDPIHPKWFAAIGMACVSILLFVLSDGRKRKNYRAA